MKTKQLTSLFFSAAAIIILSGASPIPVLGQNPHQGSIKDERVEKPEKPRIKNIPESVKKESGFSTGNSTFEKPSVETDKNKISKSSTSLFDLFKKGGPFMWPILLFAAVALGFMIERFIYFRKARLSPREFIDELEKTIEEEDIQNIEELCRESGYTMARILIKGLRLKKMGIERVEKSFAVAGSIIVSELERGLSVLSSLGNLAPMLGFLGTVSGMISAFADIAAADQVNARVVAGGIEEALLTTAAGLIVAIPTLLGYNYFVHRIEIFISDVERITADILEKLIEENND